MGGVCVGFMNGSLPEQFDPAVLDIRHFEVGRILGEVRHYYIEGSFEYRHGRDIGMYR